MQKWEYNLLVQSPNTECARCEEVLNGLGRDGWELVTFYVNGAGDNVFGRPGPPVRAMTDLNTQSYANSLFDPLKMLNSNCFAVVCFGSRLPPICARCFLLKSMRLST